MNSADVAKALAEQEIAVWDGNYYAWELEQVLGLAPHGAVRAGFLHYNDAADTERLLAAVADLTGLNRDCPLSAQPKPHLNRDCPALGVRIRAVGRAARREALGGRLAARART